MKAKLLTLVVALQVSWVCGLAAYYERAIREGTVVLLEVVPVDPRDLLRGDFAVLGYHFSILGADDFSPEVRPGADLRRGSQVYVELELAADDSRLYRMRRASAVPIEAGPGGVVLRGHVLHSFLRDDRRAYRVEYGIERFYVAEGTGTPPRDARVTAEIAVSALGQGYVREVYLDGRRYADVMRGEDAGP